MCHEIIYASIIHYSSASIISTDRLKGEQNKRLEDFYVGTGMEILIFFYLMGLHLVLVNEQGDLATASLREKTEGVTGITIRVKDHWNMHFNTGSYDTQHPSVCLAVTSAEHIHKIN